jgi:hypothetical protein
MGRKLKGCHPEIQYSFRQVKVTFAGFFMLFGEKLNKR